LLHTDFTEANRKGGQAHNKSSYQYPTPCSHKDYSQLEGWYKDLQSFGFSTLLYGNYCQAAMLSRFVCASVMRKASTLIRRGVRLEL